MPTSDVRELLRIFAPTKGGSQRKVKDTEELEKMVVTNTSQEGPDRRLHRKFLAKHLNEGGWKEKREKPHGLE